MQGSALAQNFLNQIMQNFMAANQSPQGYESANPSSQQIPFSDPSDEELQNAYDSGAYGSLAGRGNYDQSVLSRMGASHNAGVAAQDSLRKNKMLQEVSREELKQKMINTIMSVEQYKEQNSLKSRELDILDQSHGQDFMLKSQGLEENIRHHGAMEDIGRQKMASEGMQPNAIERHKINKLIQDYTEAKEEQELIKRMTNPNTHIRDKKAIAGQLPKGGKYINEPTFSFLFNPSINKAEVNQLEETNKWILTQGTVFQILLDQGLNEKAAYQKSEEVLRAARQISDPKKRKEFLDNAVGVNR